MKIMFCVCIVLVNSACEWVNRAVAVIESKRGGNGRARTLDRAMGECQDFHALFQDVPLSHAIMSLGAPQQLNRNRNSSTRELLTLTFRRYPQYVVWLRVCH